MCDEEGMRHIFSPVHFFKLFHACPGYLDHPFRKQGFFEKIWHYLGGEVSERTMTKTLILERIIQVARTASFVKRRSAYLALEYEWNVLFDS
jgi:hypothetical protein